MTCCGGHVEAKVKGGADLGETRNITAAYTPVETHTTQPYLIEHAKHVEGARTD